ncbi:branched-chain amino acid ABC transporter permease [Lacisediminimonas profundi]|uniref:branched-chain amino acid ABC transporter permease n=1 Tax=Lacisediminimonas profundi TaxID=2603856 RepID=UPI00124B44BB|nr:branched-chain amino acid ABC transporter permease [Lacisediminimonas profundi]
MPLLQAIVDGLMLGGVYAVICIGLTLVFGVVSIVNFAQAQFLMVGMYIAYFCWRHLGLDPVLGSLVSFVVVFALGFCIQHLLIRRVLGGPEVAQIFLTVGILIVLENLALIAFGSQFKSVQTWYQNESIDLFGLTISMTYAIAFVASALAGTAVWWLLAKTWWGRAVRATAQNPSAARLMGINPDHIYRVAFGLGVALTAFGGSIILPYMTVSPTVGEQFGVLMFTVVVLGGLGNVMGAVIGGLAVGVIQSLSGLFLPLQLQNIVLFIVFILTLALRPEGLIHRKA